MSAAAQPHSTPYPTLQRRAPRPGAAHRTAILTTLAVVAGALLISVLMTFSMLLLTQPRAWDAAPLAQAVPQPSAAQGLDR
jgi:hypothetical protein